ncbi:MAG: hypothetical protein HY240_05945 [Actinobacteria bacterium]|nr:hypothetical protein [Actinomycetota bacterium]
MERDGGGARARPSGPHGAPDPHRAAPARLREPARRDEAIPARHRGAAAGRPGARGGRPPVGGPPDPAPPLEGHRRQLPLHAGASQKAILAFMDPEEAASIVAGRLERLCHATITDTRLLRRELGKIRGRGWASSVEETNVGVWGVAVPVLSPRSGVVCAVGIAGPSARLATASVRADVKRVHAAAVEIARALGLPAPKVRDTETAIRRGKKT